MKQVSLAHLVVQVRNSSRPTDWMAQRLKTPLVQQELALGLKQHVIADPMLSRLELVSSRPLRVFLPLSHLGCWGS